MLVGSEIGAALVVDRRDAARRARHQLRHRPGRDAGAPALPQPALAAADQRAAQRRPAERSSTAAPTTTSRPSSWPSTTRRHVTELGVGVVGGCCGTTPEHLRQVVEAVQRPRAGPPRRPTFEPSVVVDLQPGADRAGPQLPDHRRAHQRQRLQGVPRRDARRRLGHVHEDGQRAGPRGRPRARRVRRLRRPRRRRRHGRDRQALRHPGQRAARARLHRAAGAGGRPAAHRRPGHPQLGQPRGRRAARQPLRPGDVAGPRVRRGRDLPADRRARPGPRRRVEDGDRPPHPRDRHRALRPVGQRPDLRRADVPAVDRRRRPAPRRHVHDRGDPADQGRDPRRAHDARRVQRQLRPQPGGPPRAQQRVPPRVRARPGSTRRSSTPARSCRSTGCPTSSARSAST